MTVISDSDPQPSAPLEPGREPTNGHVLAPGRMLLSRLGLVKKFSLVLAILVLPLMVVGFGYMSGAAKDRAFTAKELRGAAVLASSVDLFEATVQLRAMAFAGTDLAGAIAEATPTIAAQSAKLGVRGAWNRTKAALDAAVTSATTDLAVRARAVALLQDFLITVGDRSNLTLDPELDTYYLMDASQVRYPDVVAMAGEVRLVDDRLTREGASVMERWSRVRDLARLISDDLAAISSGLATASETAHDAAISRSVALRSAQTAGRARPLDAALGTLFEVTSVNEVDARLAATALESFPRVEQLHTDWAASVDDLHTLLEARARRMAASRTRLLTVAGLCSLIAGYLVLSLFSGLLRSLREMRRVLHRAATGDLEATIEADGSDEIAEVSRAINHAVAKVAEVQAELAHRARHDGLTGLPNRHTFVETLQQRIDDRDGRAPISLCFIDLDGFKAINDLHGHHNGDRVLKVTADRLRGTMPEGSLCSRLAGDEFGVLFPAGLSVDAGRHFAGKVGDVLREPIEIAGYQARVVLEGASVGLATHDGQQALDAEGLLATADFAMYEAKSSAPGLVREFTVDLADAVRRRLTLRGDLVNAFETGDRSGLWVAYQPIVDLRTDGIVGCEALARWNHPQLGPISPAEFVPVAEAHGLIASLRDHVLSSAAERLAAWQRIAAEFYLSVNVSANELAGGMLEVEIARALDQAGVSSRDVWIELTESAMLVDPEAAVRTISSLRRLGHPVAIDDFGTGYSSLSHLHSLELSALKIDRSFIAALDDPAGSTGQKILGMTVELAHQLGLDVVAEGIETATQMAALRALDVECGQGFLLHRPAPDTQIAELLGLQSAMRAGVG